MNRIASWLAFALVILATVGCSDSGGIGDVDRDVGEERDAAPADDAATPFEVIDDAAVDDGSGVVEGSGGQTGDPCDDDFDCESFLCVRVVPEVDEGLCSTSCQDDDCPEDFQCLTSTVGDFRRACVPVSLCYDDDEDGYGYGPGCEGRDCDDTQPSVFTGADEVCNGRDDDCDGRIDENPVDAGADCETGFLGVCAAGQVQCVDGVFECLPVTPQAPETCNGRDDDCDGETDEEASDATTWYADGDGDRFGDPDSGVLTCERPTPSSVDVGTDCDDSRRDVNPSAAEICDLVDNDCDELIDEGTSGARTWYADRDEDGWGDPLDAVEACSQPDGYVDVARDCDDRPGSGFGVNPAATEVCNGVDDDCDSVVDTDAPGRPTWYADADGDGFGDPDAPIVACTRPDGAVDNDDDCDDRPGSGAAVNPDATEVCNRIDDNCVGGIDEDLGRAWFRDADGDGFGVATETRVACFQPDGYADVSGDCDDDPETGGEVNPDATEVCNFVDDNCVDGVDEGLRPTLYRDADGDGFGDALVSTTEFCELPAEGWVTLDDVGDCDDDPETGGSVNPDATEVCNFIDDNCVDGVDEGVRPTFLRDRDGDGWGVTGETTTEFCELPARGYAEVDRGGDCDDSLETGFSVNPGAVEVCNFIDDNCVDGVDEGVRPTFIADEDGDSWGVATVSTTEFCERPDRGWTTPDRPGDCNDDPSTGRMINPGAIEICNFVDDNCVDGIDEGVRPTFYVDGDDDTWGDPLQPTTEFCITPPSGYTGADRALDCDDSTSAVQPGATEIAGDNVDQDCNREEICYVDSDRDGARTGATVVSTADTLCQTTDGEALATAPVDCNDGNAAIRPGATEVCNFVDDNCVGGVDEGVRPTYYQDADADGYGNPSVARADVCSQPAGWVANNLDCGDFSSRIRPGAIDYCDGFDNDCSGGADPACPGTCAGAVYGIHGYMFCWGSSNHRTFDEARSVCAGQAMDLVVIETAEENAWVFNTANSFFPNSWDDMWIGLSDDGARAPGASEMNWRWVNGAGLPYNSWKPGEPNDDGTEDCAEMEDNFDGGRLWNDVPCGLRLEFACEWN